MAKTLKIRLQVVLSNQVVTRWQFDQAGGLTYLIFD